MIPIMSTENIAKDYGREKVLGDISGTIVSPCYADITLLFLWNVFD